MLGIVLGGATGFLADPHRIGAMLDWYNMDPSDRHFDVLIGTFLSPRSFVGKTKALCGAM
jgi:hypothetical protein